LRDYNLNIIIPHGGGFIPYQLGRFDLATMDLATTGKGETKPSEDLKEFVYYDTVIYTRESLEFLIKVMGEDHVVFGTDHPFPVSKPELFLRIVEEVAKDDKVKEKIYNKNAKKIFKMS